MGLAASQARLCMLTGRKSDLEFNSMNLSQKRMDLADKIQGLLNDSGTSKNEKSKFNFENMFKMAGTVLGLAYGGIIGSQIGQSIGGMLGNIFGEACGSSSSGSKMSEDEKQKKLAMLQQEDKKLEIKIKQIDTQHKAVQTEVESVQKVVDKNIEQSFKILG